MKAFLLTLFLYTNIFCYEVLYDKKYGTATNCVDDMPTSWTKIEGGAITSCPDSCTKQYDSSAYVRFVSDQSSTQGLKFQFTQTTTQPFSYVGVDILYFQTGGSSITLRINNSSTGTVISSPKAATYEENYSIVCPDTRSFKRGSAKLATTGLPSGNQITINIEKDSSSQVIGIRSIRVWTNCRQNCLTCSDSQNCSVCQTGFAQRQMPTGEYVCEQTNDCTISSCYSCFKGDSSEVCHRCAAGYNLNSSGTVCTKASATVCPAYSTGNCSQYTFECQYQDRITKNWTTCVNQEDPRIYMCVANMVVRIYDIENYGVFQCGCGVPDCYQCTASSSTCSTCQSGYTYNSGSNTCTRICSAGQYYDSSNSTCQGCTVNNCAECSQSGTCDTCQTNYIYNNTNQTCTSSTPTCGAHQYYNSGSSSCQNCPDTNCQICNSSGVCTTCNTGYTWNSTQQRCNMDCTASQYYDSTNNNCINCPLNCQTCNSSQCTQCNTGYTWSSGISRCNMDCSANQYYDSTNNNCINCSSNCQNCNSTQCTLCSSGYTWNSSDSRCNKDCTTSQYYDQVNNNCINCPTNCQTCNSTQCTQCNSGYTWNSGDLRCNMNCTSNQYFDSVNNNCINCAFSNCQTCSSTQCTLCNTGYTWNSAVSRCNMNCASNQYFDSVNNNCLNCPSNCQICNSTQCTQCNTGFTWNSADQRCNMDCLSNQYYVSASNTCVNCIAFCNTCNSTDCTQCQAGYTYDSIDKKCYINCSGNQYLDKVNNICNNCMANCLSCTSNSDCINCNQGYTFSSVDGKCNSNCLSNEYFNSTNNQCESCLQNCLSCNDNTSCNQCNSGYSFSNFNQICYLSCQANQYYDEPQNICVNCKVNCNACNSTKCNQCSTSYYLDSSDQTQCIACSIQNCKNCSSSSICVTCNEDYQLSQDQSKCEKKCNIQFCNQCNTSDYKICENCIEGYEFVKSKGICQPIVIYQQQETQIKLVMNTDEEGYTIKVKFSNEVSYENIETNKLISLTISNIQNYNYTITNFKEKSIDIDINSQENIKNEEIQIVFTNQNFLMKNSIKEQRIEENLVPSYVKIPQNQRIASQQIASVGKGVTTAVITSMLPIVILSNFYILINTIDITGFLYYMLFINIRHPENVVQFYSIFKNFQFPFIPNLFQDIVDPDYEQPSFPKFMENSTDLYFIKNAGQTITIHVVILGIYSVAKIMSKIKIKYVQDYFIKAVDNTWEFNGMFDLVWNTYIYPLVGVLLQFYCYDFGDSTYIINYTFHSIFSIYILGFPFFVAYIIHREQNISENKRFQIKYASLVGGLNLSAEQINVKPKNDDQLSQRESVKAFSIINQQNQNKLDDLKLQKEAFKNYDGLQMHSQDNLLLSQKIEKPSFILKLRLYNKYFNALLYFRKLLFGIILVCLAHYVYLQLLLIALLNLSMLLFIIFAQPLSSKIENIKNAVGEIVLICIGICGALLVDDSESDDEIFRLKIGWIIVAFSSFILLWHTVQLLYETLKTLLQLFRKVLNLVFQKKNKVAPISINIQQIDYEAKNHNTKSNEKEILNDQMPEAPYTQNKRKGSDEEETNIFQSHNYLPNSEVILKGETQPIRKISRTQKSGNFLMVTNNSNDHLYSQQQQPQLQVDQPKRKRQSKFYFVENSSNFLSQQQSNRGLTKNENFDLNNNNNNNINNNNNNNLGQSSTNVIIEKFD